MRGVPGTGDIPEPDRPDAANISECCETGRHDECMGVDCECDCHVMGETSTVEAQAAAAATDKADATVASNPGRFGVGGRRMVEG